MSDEENPCCPHCDQQMKKWKVPESSTWVEEYMYVCFNDDCKYYVRGWDHIMSQHQVHASYRCRVNPSTGKAAPLPVWSRDALKDGIID